MIMANRNWLTAGTVAFAYFLSLHNAFAGDFLSGTYLDPALQRQDLFARPVWNSLPEHRQVYNRPRYVGGYLASKIEPSSQEAMSWKSNQAQGNYANHRGPVVPYYYYPKPWESLNTRARQDFSKPIR
jgi:hypothetical protein